ncbi:DUF7286 family protein [Halopiger thermotolerans]
MSGNDRSTPTVSIADDDRARVPFAMIAVLLLVASIGAIATLERRTAPTVERDADLLVERTTAATQSEFRTAVLEATARAGAAPINTTAGSEVDAIASAPDQTTAFRRYVKLLVYLEAVERLPAAGQSLGAGSESAVSVPPVTAEPDDGAIGPSDAIDKVDLEIGAFDDGVDRGTIRATIHGVQLNATVDGDSIPSETRSISTTVGSPVFELHERMTEYERELNRGFFEPNGSPDPTSLDGLGQELAARLYPIAYTKAGWNRFGNATKRPADHDFEQGIGTDHAEVLTNHAIFSVQEDVFGTRDPYADRTMRPQYTCMGLDFAETIGDIDTEVDAGGIVPNGSTAFSAGLEERGRAGDGATESRNGTDDGTGPANGTIDLKRSLCEEGGLINDWVFGDESTGELPEVPPLSELVQGGLGSMAAANQKVDIPVADLARATYLEYHAERYEDPVAYLENESDAMVRRIEKEGGGLPEEFDGLDLGTGEEYDRSIADIRDELYEIDVRTDVSASAGSLPTPPSAGSEYVRDRSADAERVIDVTIDEIDHTAIRDGDGYERPIHELSAAATVDVTVVHGWEAKNETRTSPNRTTTSATDEVDVALELTIDGEYGFDAGGEYYARPDEFRVAPAPIETDYGSAAAATFDDGFETALVEVTTADRYATAERELERELERSLSGSDPDSLRRAAVGAIREKRSATLESDAVIPGERRELTHRLTDELEQVHRNFTTEWERDPLRVEISSLTDGKTPPQLAKEDIKERFEDKYVDDGPYETPEDRARAQVRRAYFDRLYYWLDLFDEKYDEQLDATEDELDTIGEDGGLEHVDQALSFVQGFANADFEPDPVSLEGSPVHDDAQYEVSGSPTYLATASINRTQESAVRAANATVLDTESDVHHDPLSIQTDNRVAWPGLPLVFPMPSKWYATLNAWSVTAKGEYARLEVSSTIGDPADSSRLTYVAEESPVEVELSDGETVQVGQNEAVDFETKTEVIVVMPGAVVQKGGPIPAVADGRYIREGTTYCAETWKTVGPNAGSDTRHCLDVRSN